MKYEVELTKQAEKEIDKLDYGYQRIVANSVKKIETTGLKDVKTRPLNSKAGLYEVKADKIRMLFFFHGNKMIVVSLVYLKQSQKAPKRFIETAIKRYKEHEKQ